MAVLLLVIPQRILIAPSVFTKTLVTPGGLGVLTLLVDADSLSRKSNLYYNYLKFAGHRVVFDQK